LKGERARAIKTPFGVGGTAREEERKKKKKEGNINLNNKKKRGNYNSNCNSGIAEGISSLLPGGKFKARKGKERECSQVKKLTRAAGKPSSKFKSAGLLSLCLEGRKKTKEKTGSKKRNVERDSATKKGVIQEKN